MSLKRKLISAATSAVAVVAFTTFVSAQDTNQSSDSTQRQEMRQRRGGKGGFGRGMRGDKGMRGKGGDKMMMRGLGRLNLSDAQRDQIRTITESHKTSTQAQREEMRALAMKRRDGIISDAEQAQLKNLRNQLKASGEQTHNAIQAILTTDQRAQLEQMKQQMKERKSERRQNRQNQTLPQSQDN